MKKLIRYIFFSLLILLFLNGCGSNNNVNSDSNEDIFQYENSKIGNNSAVINIIGQLKHSKEFKEVSLETKEEPYGMTLEYEGIEATMLEKEFKETAIYNATFLFALIDNSEWLTFDFDDLEYTIIRKELQEWYGKDLGEFTNEEDLKKLTKEYLKNESRLNLEKSN